MKGKALVIGAAGHIGNAITRALLDRGFAVTGAGRRPTPPVNLAGLEVSYRPGDGDRPGQFEQWIEGHDLVVDAAAPYPLRPFSTLEPGPNPMARAEKRTARLIHAVMREGADLVCVSSFVTRVRPRSAFDQLQTSVAHLTHPYFEVKTLIEQQILGAMRQGLQAVIVNPTYCLGPWDLHDRNLCMIPLLLKGEMSVTSGQILNVIDVRDVALAVLRAAELKMYAEPLLLAGRDIRTNELHSLICKMARVAPPAYRVPSPIGVLGALFLDLASELAGSAPPVLSSAVIMAGMFDYLPGAGQPGSLGVAARPLQETIRDAISWYRQIGYC
jgi:dihydroflavonol-4-reductase